MYVCVCKAVTESRIHRAVAEGACSVRDLCRQTGLGTSCGRCVPYAHTVLSEACAGTQIAAGGSIMPPTLRNASAGA
ncbi:MAG: (2Fe-2S)-binding protein [Gammaproteobacteria bacterium]|nr:(2Fe-2S)-binding protein [Gammaproteobacteria bacterium]